MANLSDCDLAAPVPVANVSGLGGAALLNVGNSAGTVMAGNDARVPTIPQTAIPNLSLGSLVLLTDVITALGTVQTSYNTLLAELRTAGIISP